MGWVDNGFYFVNLFMQMSHLTRSPIFEQTILIHAFHEHARRTILICIVNWRPDTI